MDLFFASKKLCTNKFQTPPKTVWNSGSLPENLQVQIRISKTSQDNGLDQIRHIGTNIKNVSLNGLKEADIISSSEETNGTFLSIDSLGEVYTIFPRKFVSRSSHLSHPNW